VRARLSWRVARPPITATESKMHPDLQARFRAKLTSGRVLLGGKQSNEAREILAPIQAA